MLRRISVAESVSGESLMAATALILASAALTTRQRPTKHALLRELCLY